MLKHLTRILKMSEKNNSNGNKKVEPEKEENIDEILAEDMGVEDESGESDDLGLSSNNEFSEFFSPSKRDFSSSPLISDSEQSRGRNLEQMQPDFSFDKEEKNKEKRAEAFQDNQTSYESIIRQQRDLINPIDDMRRMNMFLDMSSSDKVADARPTVNLPIMHGANEVDDSNIVKYAERRKDPWTQDITEADRRGDVRKYFRPKA